MIAYLDSSVVLRKLLNAPGSLEAWGRWDTACTSVLLDVEVSRGIDRLRLQGALTDAKVSAALADLRSLLPMLDLIPLSEPVLRRAAQPFPTTLKTLDALHLSSALLWQPHLAEPLRFLTHDSQLETAARAMGFQVSL